MPKILYRHTVQSNAVSLFLKQNILMLYIGVPELSECTIPFRGGSNHISSTFFSNSEAFASELLENVEEMFPLYYTHSDMLSLFKPSTTL